MDSALIPEGVKRCSVTTFFFWTLPWLGLLAFGAVSVFFCLFFGLNQTNMSNIFAFALWVVFDLAVIALGAGGFFTSFFPKSSLPSSIDTRKRMMPLSIRGSNFVFQCAI